MFNNRSYYSPVPPGPSNVERQTTKYGSDGCETTSISACGPKICWVCPDPNKEKNWLESDRARGVDQVRKNIYYGAVVSDFKPRSEINDKMCDRLFLNSPNKPPYEYASATEVEFYLRHGESSGCSPFWRFRYDHAPDNMGGPGKYERVGPAPFTPNRRGPFTPNRRGPSI